MNKLLRLDIRLIYIVLALVVFAPLYRPLGLPLSINEPTKRAFDFVETLPSGSIVVFCTDVTPATEPENWTQCVAMAKHSMRLGHRLLLISTVPEGVMYGHKLVQEYSKGYGLEYGKDIVLMPYRAGEETVVAAFGEDPRSLYEKDYYGTPTADLGLMQSINSIKDVALINTYSGGSVGHQFARQVEAKHGVPVICGVVSAGVISHMPYYTSGQLKGMLQGMAGSAEYELITKVPGKAVALMDAQSTGHGFFVFLLILGNIAYFAGRQTKGGQVK
ncbi:MAG: hypothetical protein Q8P50_08365 [Bacillota bacterium]|nr:hypothetical protein [Bacillota bacterium]